MTIEDRLQSLESRLSKLEEAIKLLTEVVRPIAENFSESKAAAKQKKRWFRQEPIAKGRWLNLFAVGFGRPKP